MNPLLEKFTNSYETAPFSQIKSAHFKPAFQKAIKEAKAEVAAIVDNPEIPSFENTTVALENSGKLLDRVSNIFFNLNAAETNKILQQIAQEVAPWLSEFSNDIRLNDPLFQKVKTVYDSRSTLHLNPEESMLLEKQYKGFSRNGANLQEKDKATLREIDTQLSQLSLQFGEHVLAETNAYELHILK